ncbi:MAG: AI-2E family transporter, partial [Candidatus Competibacteraceae bacterium]|nr:AI-2E family transporter [Candidatus Competibacteraceae bacterium]
ETPMNQSPLPPPALDKSWNAHRALIYTGVTVAVVLLLLALWYLSDVVLLTFAGILLAIFLRGLALGLCHWTRIPLGLGIILVILLFFTAITGAIWWMGPYVINGIDQLAREIPQALERLQAYVARHPDLERIVDFIRAHSQGDGMVPVQELGKRLAGIFYTTLGAVTAILIILVNGLYLMVNPGVYVRGLVHLISQRRRSRAREVLEELEYALRWWLVGRITSMVVVGLLTYIGLMLLGVSSAPILALIAGLLAFVPNIGPVLSAIPAVLSAYSESLNLALWVIMLYIVIQTIESYLITPVIQWKAVTVPPALLLASQLALGIAFGLLGLFLANPITVVLLVLVQMLYVSDMLRDDIQPP